MLLLPTVHTSARRGPQIPAFPYYHFLGMQPREPPLRESRARVANLKRGGPRVQSVALPTVAIVVAELPLRQALT